MPRSKVGTRSKSLTEDRAVRRDLSRSAATPHVLLLTALQQLSEVALKNEVLIPLFTALGYTFVEDHHGPAEQGKDLICWTTHPFGDKQVAVVQIKKLRPKRNAADVKSFSEIVTQLSQAAEKPIPNLDGRKYHPAEVFFVTPFVIDTHTLATRFEAIPQLRQKNVRIVDGNALVALLLKALPALAAELSGESLAFDSASINRINNDALLNALDAHDRKPLDSFYVDVNFSPLNTVTSLFLTAPLTPTALAVEISVEEWLRLRECAKLATSQFGVSLLIGSIGEVESRADALLVQEDARKTRTKALSRYRSELNELREVLNNLLRGLHERRQERNKKCHETELQLEGLNIRRRTLEESPYSAVQHEDVLSQIARVQAHLNGLAIDPAKLVVSLLGCCDSCDRATTLPQLEDSCTAVKAMCAQWERHHTISSPDSIADRLTIPKLMKQYMAVSKRRIKAHKVIGGEADRSIEARLNLTIDGKPLAKAFAIERKWITAQIVRFNQRAPMTRNMREFLVRCSRIISAATTLL